MVADVKVEEGQMLQKMKERVDRLMFAVQREIRDGDFRVDIIADLVTLRRKFDERSNNDERGSN